MEQEVILSVKDLNVKFSLRGQVLHAIRGISLDIYKGESLAIVGGVPGNGMEGSIIVGYDIGTLQRLCEENNGFSSLSFSIASA